MGEISCYGSYSNQAGNIVYAKDGLCLLTTPSVFFSVLTYFLLFCHCCLAMLAIDNTRITLTTVQTQGGIFPSMLATNSTFKSYEMNSNIFSLRKAVNESEFCELLEGSDFFTLGHFITVSRQRKKVLYSNLVNVSAY